MVTPLFVGMDDNTAFGEDEDGFGGSLSDSFKELAISSEFESLKLDKGPTENEQSRDDEEKPTTAEQQQQLKPAPSPLPLEFGSRKDMLLRLLESEHFDAWIGLSYLWKYNGKDVGIQFYLCEKLKARPLEEIEFLLPQIWYNRSINPLLYFIVT